MAATGVDVVSTLLHGSDRATVQTGLRHTVLARVRPGDRLGQRHVRRQSECTPVRMPQTKLGIDQHPERRDMQGKRPTSPALKRPAGWPAEWVERPAPEFAGQCVDRASGPAIERIGPAIAILRAVLEDPPMLNSREPDQDQRPHGQAVNIGQCIAGLRMKSTPCGQSRQAEQPAEFCVCRSQSFIPRRSLYGNQSACRFAISSRLTQPRP